MSAISDDIYAFIGKDMKLNKANTFIQGKNVLELGKERRRKIESLTDLEEILELSSFLFEEFWNFEDEFDNC